MSAAGDSTERRAQVAAGLARVEQRIRAACTAADRDRAEVTLIAVTKTFPASDVRLLAGLGVTQVGENRDQDAAPKARACADLPLTWHFVGQLQTNKCRSVVRYADVVHGVDRARLITVLGREAEQAGRTITTLIQVDLDASDASGRGGARPDDVPVLADALAGTPGLRLGGVMAVAPRDMAPDAAFTRLAQVSARLRDRHPDAALISAGMSGDLEQAIACGATHIRVGAALLGDRAPLVG